MKDRPVAVGRCPVTKKLQFESQAVARRYRKTLKHEGPHKQRSDYECVHCGMWHTTSWTLKQYKEFCGGLAPAPKHAVRKESGTVNDHD